MKTQSAQAITGPVGFGVGTHINQRKGLGLSSWPSSREFPEPDPTSRIGRIISKPAKAKTAPCPVSFHSRRARRDFEFAGRNRKEPHHRGKQFGPAGGWDGTRGSGRSQGVRWRLGAFRQVPASCRVPHLGFSGLRVHEDSRQSLCDALEVGRPRTLIRPPHVAARRELAPLH